MVTSYVARRDVLTETVSTGQSLSYVKVAVKILYVHVIDPVSDDHAHGPYTSASSFIIYLVFQSSITPVTNDFGGLFTQN